MIYEATSKLNVELSTPYDQCLCQEAPLGLRGLENDTGHPVSNPMNGRLHDQREFKVKLVLECFTSKQVCLGLKAGICSKIHRAPLTLPGPQLI